MLRKTTRGVDLLCIMKFGTNDDGSDRIKRIWYLLKGAKASHSLKVAQFAVERDVDKIPVFIWWVSYTLKKRYYYCFSEAIAKPTHKYRIKISASWKYAIKINIRSGHQLWQDT